GIGAQARYLPVGRGQRPLEPLASLVESAPNLPVAPQARGEAQARRPAAGFGRAPLERGAQVVVLAVEHGEPLRRLGAAEEIGLGALHESEVPVAVAPERRLGLARVQKPLP